MPFQKGHRGFGTKESYIKRGKKISIARKGQRLSLETRRKISEANKGRDAWNKGIKVDRSKYPTMGHFQKHTEATKLAMSINHPHSRDEKIGTWKGDTVGYRALHDWVRVRRGKPKVCEFCGSQDRMEWANKSHEYKRDISDWLELCHKCHMKYDSGENRGKAKEKYGK